MYPVPFSHGLLTEDTLAAAVSSSSNLKQGARDRMSKRCFDFRHLSCTFSYLDIASLPPLSQLDQSAHLHLDSILYAELRNTPTWPAQTAHTAAKTSSTS